jgi:hypothetical protein
LGKPGGHGNSDPEIPTAADLTLYQHQFLTFSIKFNNAADFLGSTEVSRGLDTTIPGYSESSHLMEA